MTCKDCIHENVCNALIKSGCPYLDEEVPADAFCMEFRNTADVVPKSEVEYWKEQCFHACMNNGCLDPRIITQRLETSYGHKDPAGHKGTEGEAGQGDLNPLYRMSEADVAREIFEEIEKLHLHVTNEFDLRRYNELKKKYTEGEPK